MALGPVDYAVASVLMNGDGLDALPTIPPGV